MSLIFLPKTMIILRTTNYSDNMVNNITSRLDREGVEDYEVSDSIPSDSISITSDLKDTKIYIPTDFEYSQFEIDDYIRSLISYMRPTTTYDRNIYVMKLTGRLSEVQYYKIVKYIATKHEFCVIINKEN